MLQSDSYLPDKEEEFATLNIGPWALDESGDPMYRRSPEQDHWSAVEIYYNDEENRWEVGYFPLNNQGHCTLSFSIPTQITIPTDIMNFTDDLVLYYIRRSNGQATST